LALTSPTSDGHSVGIACGLKATKFSFLMDTDENCEKNQDNRKDLVRQQQQLTVD
jgi:hypothetical protein